MLLLRLSPRQKGVAPAGHQGQPQARLRPCAGSESAATPKKRFVATTISDYRLSVHPNLGAEMGLTVPEQLWVSDLTYIYLGHEFTCLTVVLNACSRRCLGWSLGHRLDAVLATSALKLALKDRKPQAHHSDRGVQYASAEYTGLLKNSSVQISMNNMNKKSFPMITRRQRS